MELTKLSDIEDDLELWRGTRIRLLNHDMHPDDKYFDYILTLLPWDQDSMILVNITDESHKAGAVYATKVPVDRSSNKIVVTKSGLQQSLGQDFDFCFIIK